MQKRISLFAAFLLLCVTTVMAQVTTSGLSGKVTDGKEDVIGAIVEVTHTPSGTHYKAVTNSKGQFTINGMRVGGPYTVEISYIGFQTKVINDINLQLGETYRLKATMSEDSKELSNVIVTGTASKFGYERTGASTNISNAQMLNMPTTSRSITDFTRLSPYGGNGMTFQGTDGRTAAFTVDGASFNNDFGLSKNLPGGGNPISIDAIEEMQIVVSPFDVRQSGFIGGGVNAITKSGTNTFKGTAYVYHRNENLRGDAVYGEQVAGAREKDRTTTYGATFSGPIIKDKLFFFLNGEMIQTPTVVNRWRGSEDGVADADNYVSRATLADLKRVSDYVAKDPYNYNTGSWTSFPADESNYKFLAKLDWNIDSRNKLSLRYNFTKNRNWQSPNASSMDGGTRMSGSRMSQYSMSYANSMYANDNLIHSWTLDLNSRLTDNLSNQFLATYTKKNDVRYTDSSEFPFIDILKDDQAYISLGYELFTWNNAVHSTTWNIKDDVTYYFGDHKIMAGLGLEHQMCDNMYMRNGTGYYRYASVDDFINGATPEIVCLTYGYNGETDPASRVSFNRGTFYAQDDWNVTDNLKLTLGLRFDGFFYDNSDLMTNQALLDVDYDGRRMDTGTWPSSKVSISPRVGFNWDVFGDKSLKVRGGTGLFTGRLPLVFFTNMPTNSGMVQYNAQLNNSNLQKLTKKYGTIYDAQGNTVTDMSYFAGGVIPSKEAIRDKIQGLYYLDKDGNKQQAYPSTINPEDGAYSSGMCGVDPSFKMPQVWKTSIAVDYQFPVSFPLSITAEGIFNKTINGATIDDWSVPSVEGFARFNGADNRAIFPAGYQTNSSLYVLTNTNKGYGYSASVSLNGRPADWCDFMMSYTHSVYKELTSLPGSSASSVLNYIGTVDGPNPNNMRLHDAINTTPDRFIAALNLHDKSHNHYSFIYECWNGSYNYTYMMQNDMNGDGYNYDLLYIPTDEQVNSNQFRFVSEDDKKRFMDYVHNNDYLKAHQGEYAETYGAHNPFVHRIDFAYKHDFTLNLGPTAHKLQLSLDVKNVLNLFNSEWGVQKYGNQDFVGSSNDFRVLKYEGVDKDGYATYSTAAPINGNTETWKPLHAVGQCWYASVGVKYFFEGPRRNRK